MLIPWAPMDDMKKRSASPRLITSFLLNEILKFVFQLNFFFSTNEAIAANSKPLFLTSPTFCQIVVYPDVDGTGT